MSAKYPAVYALLRERMADDNDIPDTDEIIAAAFDVAAEVARGLQFLVQDGPLEQYDKGWNRAAEIAAEEITRKDES